MARETQVIPVVIVASEVINKTICFAVFGSNLCTATLCPQQKKLDEGKDQFFSIIFDYVSHELKHKLYIVFSCFLLLLMGMGYWARSYFYVWIIAIMRLNIIMVSHIF